MTVSITFINVKYKCGTLCFKLVQKRNNGCVQDKALYINLLPFSSGVSTLTAVLSQDLVRLAVID